ncbi:MAG: hypothetical protein GY784_17730 [Gammaproteobacteria bacterium]|nr:hypothetical protein [Gammaproteobacteria bacterium]
MVSLLTKYPDQPGVIHRLVKGLSWIVIGIYALPGAFADEPGLEAKIELLDEAFQQLAYDFYTGNSNQLDVVDSVAQLSMSFDKLSSQQASVPAYQLVFANLEMLGKNSSDPLIPRLVEHLLSENQRQLAEVIYSQVSDFGDESNLSYLNFVFAKFYARHQQWQRVESLIKDSFDGAIGSNIDYAYLLQGSALQHLKQHRQSIESYDNIPATSAYHIHARLNTALANIRQGWLTEARLIIEPLLANSPDRTDELTNRIYLFLGYALLQKEYYRDARKAFRQISRDSQYTNQALMGISLAAISQEDYPGSLKTVTVLKQGKGSDLSSDEAYLLAPYIYEKLDQPLNISSSFAESVDHYQSRLLQLSAISNRALDFDTLQLESTTGDLVLDGIRFNFSRQFPDYLFQNREFLSQLQILQNNAEMKAQISALMKQYDQVLTAAVFKLVDQRTQFIKSYLNQSRFGLARHYDNQPAVSGQ